MQPFLGRKHLRFRSCLKMSTSGNIIHAKPSQKWKEIGKNWEYMFVNKYQNALIICSNFRSTIYKSVTLLLQLLSGLELPTLYFHLLFSIKWPNITCIDAKKKSWDLLGWNLVGGKILPFILTVLYYTLWSSYQHWNTKGDGLDRWNTGTGHNTLKMDKKVQ